jgi:uncharacterized repeat protein (TIGR01451 family)
MQVRFLPGVSRVDRVHGLIRAKRHLGLGFALLTFGAGLVAAAPASALTLGGVATSGGSFSCDLNEFVAQQAVAGPPNYVVPAGGGVITQWSTGVFNTLAEGQSITLLLLEPVSGFSYEIVNFDTETVPASLPANHDVTFTPAVPVLAPAGAVLGLIGNSSNEECGFNSGTSGDGMQYGDSVPTPSLGATYNAQSSEGDERVNASANLVQSIDAGLTSAAHPTAATVGGVAAFTFTLTNRGVSSGTASFSDSIPNGLSIVSAAAGSGSCGTISQLVNCSIAVTPGSSSPITILVSTGASGKFSNTGTVTTSPIADPNSANNFATSTLAVNAAPTAPAATCHIVSLKGIPVGLAESVLRALSCGIGKVSKATSKTIAKGDVISTSPSGGKKRAGTKVKIVESSGKPKKSHKH